MIAEMRGVSKVFTDRRGGKGVVALNNVSLQIEEGEFLCIIGSSGCGKSSTLNLLAGFELPTRGEVLFRGERVEGPSPRCGVVFQDYSLYPWMNVLANVMFSMPGKDRESKREGAMDALRLVGLESFAHSRPNDLSGGMKQRVAIARALAMDPDLLLMDEPFGSLDERTRGRLDAEVLSIWEKKRKTVVFVTHNIDEALALGTRVILMSASPGRIAHEWRLDPEISRHQSNPEIQRLRAEMVRHLEACACAAGSPSPIITLNGISVESSDRKDVR